MSVCVFSLWLLTYFFSFKHAITCGKFLYFFFYKINLKIDLRIVDMLFNKHVLFKFTRIKTWCSHTHRHGIQLSNQIQIIRHRQSQIGLMSGIWRWCRNTNEQIAPNPPPPPSTLSPVQTRLFFWSSKVKHQVIIFGQVPHAKAATPYHHQKPPVNPIDITPITIPQESLPVEYQRRKKRDCITLL